MFCSKKQAMYAGLIEYQSEIEIRSAAPAFVLVLRTTGLGVRHLCGAAVERHKMRMGAHLWFKLIDWCAGGVDDAYPQILRFVCFEIGTLRQREAQAVRFGFEHLAGRNGWRRRLPNREPRYGVVCSAGVMRMMIAVPMHMLVRVPITVTVVGVSISMAMGNIVIAMPARDRTEVRAVFGDVGHVSDGGCHASIPLNHAAAVAAAGCWAMLSAARPNRR